MTDSGRDGAGTAMSVVLGDEEDEKAAAEGAASENARACPGPLVGAAEAGSLRVCVVAV